MTATDTLERLQKWYLSQCNGDWEHGYGPTLTTLENPGWHLRINLSETDLADAEFSPVNIQRLDKDNWISCRREGQNFDSFCGPLNLTEMLQIFLDWAEPLTKFSCEL